PCLRCVFPEPPSTAGLLTCDTAGILGPVVSIVAAHEAAEAIKLLIGRPDLVEFDLWTNQHRRLSLARARDPDCPCCVGRRFEFLEGRAAQDTPVVCT